MDRLAQVLENQIMQMRRSLELLDAGVMSTSTNGKNTTEETKDQFRVWIADLEAALSRHEVRNA